LKSDFDRVGELPLGRYIERRGLARTH